MSSLDNIEFEDDADLEKAIVGSEVSQGNGLSVIISDFFTTSDWKKAVDYLSYKKRQVFLIQIMSPEERDPAYSGRVSLVDSEAVDALDEKNMRVRITRGMQQAYQEALNDYIEDMSSFCASRGAGFITVTSDKPIEKVIFGELLKTGILE